MTRTIILILTPRGSREQFSFENSYLPDNKDGRLDNQYGTYTQ